MSYDASLGGDTYAFIVETGLISDALTAICSKRREIFLGLAEGCDRMGYNGTIKDIYRFCIN